MMRLLCVSVLKFSAVIRASPPNMSPKTAFVTKGVVINVPRAFHSFDHFWEKGPTTWCGGMQDISQILMCCRGGLLLIVRCIVELGEFIAIEERKLLIMLKRRH